MNRVFFRGMVAWSTRSAREVSRTNAITQLEASDQALRQRFIFPGAEVDLPVLWSAEEKTCKEAEVAAARDGDGGGVVP